jgi:hypothetical protein
VSPDAPQTTLRIGRALITPLRPYEAALRYQLLLYELLTGCVHAGTDLYTRKYILVIERDRR